MEQRMSLITLGVADLAQSRRFYEHGLGWKPSSASNANITFYQIRAPGVIAGKCTVSVLSLSPHNHMSETIAAPTELM